MRVLACLLALAAPAAAEPYFACEFGQDRDVTVTHDAETARYAFRHPTNSLTLTRPFAQIDYTPWPGMGRTIWEEIGFDNAGYRYTVFAGIDRDPEVTNGRSGGIIVSKDGREIVRLDCRPDSINFPWSTSLLEAMEAAGRCLDIGSQSWIDC
ncbi:MAG: hypothetical protein OIF48_17330 [Silicimonas sp.]|nr:hypothetical protein [Silicimonas sp.]